MTVIQRDQIRTEKRAGTSCSDTYTGNGRTGKATKPSSPGDGLYYQTSHTTKDTCRSHAGVLMYRGGRGLLTGNRQEVVLINDNTYSSFHFWLQIWIRILGFYLTFLNTISLISQGIVHGPWGNADIIMSGYNCSKILNLVSLNHG